MVFVERQRRVGIFKRDLIREDVRGHGLKLFLTRNLGTDLGYGGIYKIVWQYRYTGLIGFVWDIIVGGTETLRCNATLCCTIACYECFVGKVGGLYIKFYRDVGGYFGYFTIYKRVYFN